MILKNLVLYSVSTCVWPSLQFCRFECTQGWRLCCATAGYPSLLLELIRLHSPAGRGSCVSGMRGGLAGHCHCPVLWFPAMSHPSCLQEDCPSLMLPVLSGSREYRYGLFAHYSLQVLTSPRDLISTIRSPYNSRNLKKPLLQYRGFFLHCPSG